MLHEKIESKGQQCGVLIFLTVSGHKQQQQYDQKIFRIKIFRKQLFQKASYAFPPDRLSG
ncbi:MAG: hypothetical protein IJB59_02350 [Oscillospiraceae bacterium]|nr:hypothetical protein [Oscillospiraceae bacterium]